MDLVTMSFKRKSRLTLIVKSSVWTVECLRGMTVSWISLKVSNEKFTVVFKARHVLVFMKMEVSIISYFI